MATKTAKRAAKTATKKTAKKSTAKKGASTTAKRAVKKFTEEVVIIPYLKGLATSDYFVARVTREDEQPKIVEGYVLRSDDHIFFLTTQDDSEYYDTLSECHEFTCDRDQEECEEYETKMEGYNYVFLNSEVDDSEFSTMLRDSNISFISITPTKDVTPNPPKKDKESISGYRLTFAKGFIDVGCTKISNKRVRDVAARLID